MRVPAKYYCDICGDEIDEQRTTREVLALHTVDDEEGRACKPYVAIERLDLCDECYIKCANVKIGFRGSNPELLKGGMEA